MPRSGICLFIVYISCNRWYKESEKHYSYGSQSILNEELRYAEDSTGTFFYELVTYLHDPDGNMTQRNWYRPPMGIESMDTTVQDWYYKNIYQYSYDAAGNVLTRLDSLNKDADHWSPPGIYLLSVQQAHKTLRTKFVKY